MKTHLIGKNLNETACGRHIDLGANRCKKLWIVGPKKFVSDYKMSKNNCCARCVAKYNERVRERS